MDRHARTSRRDRLYGIRATLALADISRHQVLPLTASELTRVAM